MKVFVTGATGRVGSRLVPRLLRRGDSVRLLVRQPLKAQALSGLGAEMVEGDLQHTESFVHALNGMDAVIHLAAFFRGATPEESQAVNLEGTLSLARAAVRQGVSRFVFASTNLVYGPGATDKLFREDDPPAAAAPYPQAKAAAEESLMALHRLSGLDLRILRLAFVYGDNDPHLTEGLGWFRNWNPQQRIHLVHHADVAQAAMLALDTAGIDGQIYNVADDSPMAAAEIMKLYNEPSAGDAAARPMDPAWLQIVDTAKIRDRLGYRPIYPSLRRAAAAGAL